MTRVDEFDAFYHDSRRQVLHQTNAATGDLTAAILAVQDAYAHAWQHWPKLRHSDPLSQVRPEAMRLATDRKSIRLNSSHLGISYAVFCLKKKKKKHITE